MRVRRGAHAPEAVLSAAAVFASAANLPLRRSRAPSPAALRLCDHPAPVPSARKCHRPTRPTALFAGSPAPQLGKEIKGKAMAAVEDEEASGPAVARFVEKAVASSLVSMLVSRAAPSTQRARRPALSRYLASACAAAVGDAAS